VAALVGLAVGTYSSEAAVLHRPAKPDGIADVDKDEEDDQRY
jgi:hypothetical protein